MAVSLYEITVPSLLRGFGVLETYLDRARSHAEAAGFDPGILVNARLYPDMASFAGQIQRASDTAKASITRLTGLAAPSFADTETSLADLEARCRNTAAFIRHVDREAFAGAAERQIEIRFGANPVVFTGTAYALQFMLPNFHFHVATAHDILRHNGVAIGKRDYLGSFS